MVDLGGSGVTLRDLTIQNTAGTTSNAAVEITGTGQRVEHVTISHTTGHGILIHSDGTNSVVTRNFLSDLAYSSGNTQIHGIYVAGSGNTVSDNVVYHPSAYGIHLYTASSHDNVVAENTVVGSATRAGILVDTTGANEKIVNNILVGNPTGGLLARACGASCVYDHTLGFNNGANGTVTGANAAQATNVLTADPLFTDSAYHLAASSPAVDWSNPGFVFSPDLDGTARPQGAAADSGAYER
jgi:parallel beta-helix repeat protein